MQEDSKEQEKKMLQALLSPPDPAEVPTQAELEETLDAELAKDAADMDVELIAFCAQCLCELHGCVAADGEKNAYKQMRSKARRRTRRAAIMRWVRRTGAAVAVLMLSLVAGEWATHKPASVVTYHSDDGEQYVVEDVGSEKGILPGADAEEKWDDEIDETGPHTEGEWFEVEEDVRELETDDPQEAIAFLGYPVRYPTWLPPNPGVASCEVHMYAMSDVLNVQYAPAKEALSQGVKEGEKRIRINIRRDYLDEGRKTMYEENGPGRTLRLSSGSEAYLSSNMDWLWSVIIEPPSRYYISVHGYDEETLIRVLESI